MVTVTAKQLREHLSMYLDRMEAGEEIAVIRHSEIIGRLKPTAAGSGADTYGGVLVGKRLDNLLADLPQSISPMMRDPNKTYKQLQAELYRRDPKYRRYITEPDGDGSDNNG